MTREMSDSVVVITGASSGIGRATALEFAKQGSRVVLASRNKRALKEAADECEELGASTLMVPTDVTDEEEVRSLAEQAVDEFGRIDVWVNNAGVGAYARFEDTPEEDFRRVIETNLFGCVYGARAVLPYFRKQGRGVLINVSSQIALGGTPYTSAYGVSKHGVRALGDSLRQEFVDTDIYICTLFPASTDTPFFQHAANYTGREVKPLGSVSSAEEVGREIVSLAREPKPEVLVGAHGYFMGAAHGMAPEAYDRFIARKTDKDHFKKERARNRSGNLFSPSRFEAVSGGWGGAGGSIGKAIAGIGAAAGAGLLLWYSRRRGRETTEGFARRTA